MKSNDGKSCLDYLKHLTEECDLSCIFCHENHEAVMRGEKKPHAGSDALHTYTGDEHAFCIPCSTVMDWSQLEQPGNKCPHCGHEVATPEDHKE